MCIGVRGIIKKCTPNNFIKYKINVPADFDTIEKAFSGVKTAEKGIKQGLPRSNADFGSPCLLYSVIDFCRSRVRPHRGIQALRCTDFGIIRRCGKIKRVDPL